MRAKEKEEKAKEEPEHVNGESTPDTNNLLQALSRLVLRHEDTLQRLATETGFYVFLSAGPGSILPAMMTQTTNWHQTPQNERTHPLRILVLKSRTAEEDPEASIHGLLRSLDPNVATPGIPEDGSGPGEHLRLPQDEVGSSKAGHGPHARQHRL